MSMVKTELEKLRSRLLDLTMRNRLLAYRESKTQTIRIVDERPEEIYDLLVFQEKSLEFLAGDTTYSDDAEDDDDAVAEESQNKLWRYSGPDATVAKHHRDLYLQTPYDPLGLQKRLFYAEKKSAEALDEQGYTVLFVAMGYIEWHDDSNKPRIAPTILIPVELKRASVTKPYRLKWTGEEIQFNISLREKLANSFGMDLPVFDPELVEEKSTLLQYLEQVRRCAESKSGWRILDSVYLDFFVFAKFVMYKDLDSAHWPDDHKPWDHEVVNDILNPGEEEHGEVFDERNVDDALPLSSFYSIMDCDPSQTAVVESAKMGRNLAVEGPPGTGKSQTISNLIAELLAQEKSVLFVSEKMAALEVVKRRLDSAGFGDFCVELHSRKANKKVFLESLEHTLKISPKLEVSREEYHIAELQVVRDQLNAYAEQLRAPFGEAGLSPFQLFGMRERAAATLATTLESIPSVPLASMRSVSRTGLSEVLELLRSVEILAGEFGGVYNNPWAECRIEQVFPNDIDHIRTETQAVLDVLGELRSTLRALSDLAPVRLPTNVAQIRAFRDALQIYTNCPPIAPGLFSSEDITGLPSRQERCLKALSTLNMAKKGLTHNFSVRLFEEDHGSGLSEFKSRSSRLLRIFDFRFHALRRQLLKLYGEGARPSSPEIIRDLEALVSVQTSLRNFREVAIQGEGAFGSLWRGENSSIDELHQCHEWTNKLLVELRHGFLPKSWPSELATVEQRRRFREIAKRFLSLASDFIPLLEKLFNALRFDVKARFGRSANEVDFDEFIELLATWLDAIGNLQRWAQYNMLREALLKTKAGSIINAIEGGRIPARSLEALFELCFCDAILRDVFTERPGLAQFSGVQHENRIQRFRDLDSTLLEVNKARLRRQLYENRPRVNQGASTNSEAGILLGQFARKRGHLPIRKLMSRSGALIQKIKPCFMMSPLSVAQFLDPRTTRFDVVIFDEASQVRPEDAIGAILRGNQLVVAGDTRQLPPTSFFDVMAAPEDDDDPGVVGASQVESILHQCRRSFPVRYLKWHYRSKHQSLIAVSNTEFYDNQLLIYPAAENDASQIGLSFVHLPDTVYDRGKSACNRMEAKAVARNVISHFEVNHHLTLGVGTFSVAQQNAILEEVELLLRENPGLEERLYNERGENFFVKNLETIQGDERDVIFLSVGYGRDGNGKLSSNFGPLNQEGGERRLNVLITRARLKCVVFSNFTAEDLKVDVNASYGVRSFKVFLKYAETGLLLEQERSGSDTESPFEQSVYEFLRSQGFEVAKQIGCAGFRIDLAIIDPQNPGRYLLGVECDGAMYHSSVVARERDRLRQQILEGLGWKGRLHRIWSTDWFRDSKGTQERLMRAVEVARTAGYKSIGPANRVLEPVRELAREDVTIQYGTVEGGRGLPRIDSTTHTIEPAFSELDQSLNGRVTDYAECDRISSAARRYELIDAPLDMVVESVCAVVAVEAPIHEEEIIRRLRTLWGYGRAGAKIQAKVQEGVHRACVQGKIRRKGKFIYQTGDSCVIPRRRDKARIEYIADEELDAAVCAVLEAQYATEERELVVTAARTLGFERTSKTVEQVMLDRIAALAELGVIMRKSNGLIDLAK